ncbi:MAG: hypothetical protein R3C51_07220 [Parvularculaceae bacterium]
MMFFAEDADPRFGVSDPEKTENSALGRGKKRPRVAFTGEEWGFGYQATRRFLERARKFGTVSDGGLRGVFARTEREYDEASRNSKFDYGADVPQPLRTKEQTLMAVKQGAADFAVIPFYSPYSGYDYESLRALSSLMTLLGVEQIEATDNLCLAVHESQLYDLIQSSHPGSGFSALQRRIRKSWGAVDNGSGNDPGGYEAEMPRAGLPIDMADQKLIRDRIDLVFAGPEAARRCKSKLDGMRAIGVDVQETPQMLEPHRELAKRARSTANTSRQTNTFFDPTTGETRFFSSLGAEAQKSPLFGMVLPYEVAMRSSDYVIIDHDIDDAPPTKTRFLVVENNPDHTLFEDAYRTTDARTRYWMNRLRAIADGRSLMVTSPQQIAGGLLFAIGGFFALVGAAGVAGWEGVPLLPTSQWLAQAGDQAALILGTIAMMIGAIISSMQSGVNKGVRVMLRFRRDQSAASIGDVENFLRNFGVRHSVVRLDEDSEKDSPAAIMLDIEFQPEDFIYNPVTMFTRRLRGSVANGAMKKAFQRWKNRGALVLAATPIADGYQLPRHKKRRWWSEAVGDWSRDFVETTFIRLPRLLLVALPLAAIAFFLWQYLFRG